MYVYIHIYTYTRSGVCEKYVGVGALREARGARHEVLASQRQRELEGLWAVCLYHVWFAIVVSVFDRVYFVVLFWCMFVYYMCFAFGAGLCAHAGGWGSQ